MTWACVCGWAELYWRNTCTMCGHRQRGWRLRIRRMPAMDTGIGREAGYANDKALIRAADAERARMAGLVTPAFMERADTATDDAFLRGQP